LASPGEYSYRQFKGASGQKSIVSYILMKKDLKPAFSTLLDELRLPSKAKQAIMAALDNHTTMRSHYGYPTDADKADLSWQGGFKPSSQMVATLGQALIYGTDYDNEVKCCVKAKKDAADVLTADKLQEEIEAIKEALKSEKADDKNVADADIEDQKYVAPEPSAPTADGLDDSVDDAWLGNLLVQMGNTNMSRDDVDQELKEKMLKFWEQCQRKCNAVKIEQEPKTEQAVADVIKNSAVGSCSPTKESPVFMSFTSTYGGESASNPRTRPPSHRPQYFKKAVIGGILAFDDSGKTLVEGVVIAVSDGGKDGLEREITGAFTFDEAQSGGKLMTKNLEKVKQTLNLFFSEEAAAQGKDRVKGYNAQSSLATIYQRLAMGEGRAY
jgi:hypothetical protein